MRFQGLFLRRFNFIPLVCFAGCMCGPKRGFVGGLLVCFAGCMCGPKRGFVGGLLVCFAGCMFVCVAFVNAVVNAFVNPMVIAIVNAIVNALVNAFEGNGKNCHGIHGTLYARTT